MYALGITFLCLKFLISMSDPKFEEQILAKI